jgi:hypothetical protein
MYIVRTHFATQGHEHCNMMPDPYSVYDDQKDRTLVQDPVS